MDAKRVNKEYSNAEAVDIIHQVANLYISTKVPRDYGTGEEYTSVEVHTLKHIANYGDRTGQAQRQDKGRHFPDFKKD